MEGQTRLKVFSPSLQRQNLRGEEGGLSYRTCSLGTSPHRAAKAPHFLLEGVPTDQEVSLVRVHTNLPASNFQETEPKGLCTRKTIEKQAHIPVPDPAFTAAGFLSAEVDFT